MADKAHAFCYEHNEWRWASHLKSTGRDSSVCIEGFRCDRIDGYGWCIKHGLITPEGNLDKRDGTGRRRCKKDFDCNHMLFCRHHRNKRRLCFMDPNNSRCSEHFACSLYGSANHDEDTDDSSLGLRRRITQFASQRITSRSNVTTERSADKFSQKALPGSERSYAWEVFFVTLLTAAQLTTQCISVLMEPMGPRFEAAVMSLVGPVLVNIGVTMKFLLNTWNTMRDWAGNHCVACLIMTFLCFIQISNLQYLVKFFNEDATTAEELLSPKSGPSQKSENETGRQTSPPSVLPQAQEQSHEYVESAAPPFPPKTVAAAQHGMMAGVIPAPLPEQVESLAAAMPGVMPLPSPEQMKSVSEAPPNLEDVKSHANGMTPAHPAQQHSPPPDPADLEPRADDFPEKSHAKEECVVCKSKPKREDDGASMAQDSNVAGALYSELPKLLVTLWLLGLFPEYDPDRFNKMADAPALLGTRATAILGSLGMILSALAPLVAAFRRWLPLCVVRLRRCCPSEASRLLLGHIPPLRIERLVDRIVLRWSHHVKISIGNHFVCSLTHKDGPQNGLKVLHIMEWASKNGDFECTFHGLHPDCSFDVEITTMLGGFTTWPTHKQGVRTQPAVHEQEAEPFAELLSKVETYVDAQVQRWPQLEAFIKNIGMAARASMPRAVIGLSMISFPESEFQELTLPSLPPPPTKPEPLQPGEDPMKRIAAKFKQLDCPAQKGWLMHDQDENIICMCGGGSHSLTLAEFKGAISGLGFDESDFCDWVVKHKKEHSRKNLNEFLKSYPQLPQMRQKFEDRQKSVKMTNEKVDTEFQNLEKKWQQLQESGKEISAAYKKAYRDSEKQAERAYCDYVAQLLRFVPFSIHFDPCGATVAEATKAATAAIELNKEREEAWKRWQEDLKPWLNVQEAPELAASMLDMQKTQKLLHRAKCEAEKKMTSFPCVRQQFEEKLKVIENEWKSDVYAIQGILKEREVMAS